jgi:hypothetical protein
VTLDDEDEFAEHREQYGYPAEVVEAALASAAWLQEALKRRVEPFGKDFRRWLALMT